MDNTTKQHKPRTRAQSLASHRNWTIRVISGMQGMIRHLRYYAKEADSIEAENTLASIDYMLGSTKARMTEAYDRKLNKLKVLKMLSEQQKTLDKQKVKE